MKYCYGSENIYLLKGGIPLHVILYGIEFLLKRRRVKIYNSVIFQYISGTVWVSRKVIEDFLHKQCVSTLALVLNMNAFGVSNVHEVLNRVVLNSETIIT